jgi:rubrerythrin
MKRKNKMQLNVEDAIHVQDVVESEGDMNYAFRFYTDFKEIKDKKFHSLRKAYVKAAQELSDYCRLEEDLRCNDCGATLEDDECPKCAVKEDSFDAAQGIDDDLDYE